MAAEYSLAKCFENLENLWADCKIWRAVVADADPTDWSTLSTAATAITGSTGRAAAVARVYWELYDESPLAPADGSDNYDADIWPCIQLIGGAITYSFNGGWSIDGSGITALVEIPIPTAYQGRNNYQDSVKEYHYKFIGRLIEEAMALRGAGGAGYLAVKDFVLQQWGWVNPQHVGGNHIRYASIECLFDGDETP